MLVNEENQIAGSEEPTKTDIVVKQPPVVLEKETPIGTAKITDPISQGPRLAVEQSGDIAEEAQKDVQQQRQGLSAEEYLAQTTVPEDFMRISGLKARADAGDADAFMKLSAELAPTALPGQVAMPFVRDGEVVVPETIIDPQKIDKAKLLAEQKRDLNTFLLDKVPDERVRDILVSRINVGDFTDILSERLAEQGRGAFQLFGTAAGISPLNTVSKYAFFAWQDWMSGKTDTFGAAYGAYSTQIQAESQQKLNDIDEYMSGPTLGMSVQNGVKKILEEQVKDGTLSQEEYNSIVFDEQGIEKRFISDEAAQETLSYSFSEMPLSQRYAAIAIENVVTLAGFGVGKTQAGEATLKRVFGLRDEYSDLVVRGQKIGELTDPKEIVSLLEIGGKLTTNKISNKLTRINMKTLEVGIRQDKVNKTLDKAALEVQDIGKKVDAMRRAGISKKDPDFVILSNQYEAGKNRILRATFSLRTLPLVAENIETSLVISAGQLGARELLPQYTGLDADTSEMIGALTMSLGGYKPVRGTAYAVGRVAMKPFNLDNISVKEGLGRTMDFIGFVATGGASKALFTDDTIRRYAASIEGTDGVKLTQSQLKGIRYATRLIQTLDEDQMQLVVKAADDYLDLQDRIVSSFPPSMKAEVTEAFTLSFAEASSLGGLSGLTKLATGKLDARDLKSLKESTEFQMAQEAQFTRAELALENLSNLAGNIGDEAAKQDVLDFVGNAKQALRQNKALLNDEASENFQYLDELEKVMFDDLTVELPEGSFENLFLARKETMKRLGMAFDDKKEIMRLQQVFEEGLATRLEVVRGYRGTKQHEEMLRSETEAFINVHMETIKARGSAAYEDVVAFSEGRNPIDISPLVRQTLQRMNITDIENFFSKEGEFFNGKLGRQAYEVMEKMATRVIPSEQLAEIRTLLKQSDEFKGAEYVVDNLSDLEIALRVDDSSDSLNIFAQANPYEIDVMRRSFRDYGEQLRDSNPSLSRQYKKFERDLDTLIETQDPEMFIELNKARKIYGSEVGDRLRSGSTLNKLDRSRQKPKLTIKEAGLNYRYTNVDPVSVFDPITKNIGKAVAGGKTGENAKRQITGQIQNLMIDFAERVEDTNRFDLTNPASKANFDALSRVLRERVYADWAGDVIKRSQRSSGDITTRGLQEALGGYDFKRSEDWGDIENLLTVNIVDESGKKTTRSLVNIDALIANENSIEKLIETNATAKAKFAEFEKNVKNTTSQLRRDVSDAVSFEQTAFDELKEIVGTDPDSFYKNIVENGTAENIDSLRDLSVSALMRGGRNADEAMDMFDAAVKSLVSRALLNKGRVSPVQGSTLAAAKSDKKFAREITDPNVMLESIDSNREVLTAVLGDQHVSYLEDIAEFLNKAEPAQRYSIDGIIRPYGMNEGLSRVYNMARGMVSPLYVTSEYAVRLASQANIEVLQLAGQNQEAARIITNMMRYPELVTRNDLGYLEDSLKEFVLTEITKTGADPAQFFPKEIQDEEEQ